MYVCNSHRGVARSQPKATGTRAGYLEGQTGINIAKARNLFPNVIRYEKSAGGAGGRIDTNINGCWRGEGYGGRIEADSGMYSGLIRLRLMLALYQHLPPVSRRRLDLYFTHGNSHGRVTSASACLYNMRLRGCRPIMEFQDPSHLSVCLGIQGYISNILTIDCGERISNVLVPRLYSGSSIPEIGSGFLACIRGWT